jgi:hypothetical protein
MDISPKSHVSFEDVLSDSLVLCRDEDFRSGWTKGYYVSTIQRALQDLAFDTFYLEGDEWLQVDQDCFQMDMPCNMFNPREFYLHNGTPECPTGIVQVYWKRLFNNGKGGTTYTAARRDDGVSQDDPYMPGSFIGENVYYANIQNGRIMLSRNCVGFTWLKIHGNIAGTAIGDSPVIPLYFRTVLSDFVCEKFYRYKTSQDRAFQSDWAMYNERLNGENGSWNKAEKRIKTLSTWKKDTVRQAVPLWDSVARYGGNGRY